MNLEEFRKNRKARLEALHEELSNMPELTDDKAHGEVGAVEMDAIKSSKERDKLRKDSFKDKNKEVKEFIKKQDKDREVDKEEKSENRLLLDESLFEEDHKELPSSLKLPASNLMRNDEFYEFMSDAIATELYNMYGKELDYLDWNMGPIEITDIEWAEDEEDEEDEEEYDESLDDDAEFDEFKKKNPGYNKKFNNKKFGKYFDKNGELIPELTKEFFAKNLHGKVAKDESLNEEVDDTDPNDWKTMEIISEAMFDENGEYTHSNLYVGHDGGRGLKSIQEYNQIPEITDLSVGDLFDEYINEHL